MTGWSRHGDTDAVDLHDDSHVVDLRTVEGDASTAVNPLGVLACRANEPMTPNVLSGEAMTYTSLFARPVAEISRPNGAFRLSARPVMTVGRPAPCGLFTLRARPANAAMMRPLVWAA